MYMGEEQVYIQGDFSFIKNDDLRKVFINAYNNESTTKDDLINDWAKNKIKKINDECLKNWANTFSEDDVLEEYNEMKDVIFSERLNKFIKNNPVTITQGDITQGEKNTIDVPIIQNEKKGGKRKSRKSGKKTRKSRRKTKKSKKSKK